MRRLGVVTDMTLREMLRRRGVLILLLALPLAFYAVRRNDSGEAIRALFLGLSWAISAAALFSASAGRAVEPRLRLSGYRSHHLYLGRLAALLVLGTGIGLPLLALVALDPAQSKVRAGGVALAMLLCVTVAAPFGLLIAAIVPRELEGTLVLLVIVGIQMVVDPAGSAAKVMPFWSSREIATYAVDHTGSGYLDRGLVHGVAFTVGLAVLVAVLSTVRLRTRSHMRFAPGR
ncbi:hypothetical protein GCM10023322_26890 [Rugosimonospora acidiphila]|uniref:ABC transporter permease n=1 Tax=Rugosimonospora acidiphila TaxID=556531 RepID=A0ABP9RS84_9ACTN